MPIKKRTRTRAQSLVEYAIILALVALVTIGAAYLMGWVLQRMYGLITGALGATGNGSTNSYYITFDPSQPPPQCVAVPPNHQTGIWVHGLTNEPASMTLTGSTELGPGTPDTLTRTGGTFLFNPTIDQNKADLSECPASVVIQAPDGTIAEAPLLRCTGVCPAH